MNAPKKVEAESLAHAMALAFAEIDTAIKSNENPAFKRGDKVLRYADINAVIGAIKPALIKHSLFFTQNPRPHESGIEVETILHHAGGEHMSLGSLFVPADRNNAQGFGSALTYARRYALVTAFGVPVDDDDGNAAAAAPPIKAQQEPAKRAPAWDAPITGKSALHKALMALERELAGCGDSDMIYALTATQEWKDFVTTAERFSPHYLRGGDPAPEEFEGLLNTAERMVREFEAATANHMVDMARA